MSKYYGKVGFVYDEAEIEPGIWDALTVEKTYFGDVQKINRRFNQGDTTTGEFSIGHTFSILADSYGFENFFAIKYIEWQGVKWTVTSVDVEFPRLTLGVGGKYNG